MHRGAVDVANAGLDAPGHLQRAGDVAAKHGARQAIGIVIRAGYGRVYPVDPHDAFDRTEGFVAIDAHGGRDVVQQGGWHQCAVGLAAAQQGCAFFQRVVNQRVATVHSGHVHHRTQHHRALARVTQGQAGGFGGELGSKGIGHGGVNDDALGGHADLAGIGEGPKGSGVHGGFQVGIVQHQQRGFAAQFQQHRFEVLGADAGDDLAHMGGAGEIDAAHCRVGYHGLDHGGGIRRGVGDEVDHPGRQAGFL